MRQKFRLTVLLAAALGVLASFFIFQGGRGAADFDRDFLAARARELASFEDGDIVPDPEIIFTLAGEEGPRQSFFASGEKVVVIFDSDWGLGSVQAVFRAPKYEIQDGKGNWRSPVLRGRWGRLSLMPA